MKFKQLGFALVFLTILNMQNTKALSYFENKVTSIISNIFIYLPDKSTLSNAQISGQSDDGGEESLGVQSAQNIAIAIKAATSLSAINNAPHHPAKTIYSYLGDPDKTKAEIALTFNGRALLQPALYVISKESLKMCLNASQELLESEIDALKSEVTESEDESEKKLHGFAFGKSESSKLELLKQSFQGAKASLERILNHAPDKLINRTIEPK